MDKKINYRLFAFWNKTDDKDTVVLATHGIIKKTKKTPKSEIKKAEGIRKIYFEQKHRKNENIRRKSLDEMIDEIGMKGTKERDVFEEELRLDGLLI